MTFFEKYMGESTWNFSLKLGCPKDENKGVMSKGNLVRPCMRWQLKRKRNKRRPIRKNYIRRWQR